MSMWRWLAGWLHQVRALSGVTFVLVRDRSAVVQTVFDREPAELAGVHAESVVAITGTVVTEPRAALGVELHDARITVISPVMEPLPFGLNKKVLSPALDTLLDHAPVGLRHPTKQATFRLVAAMGQALRASFIARGCTEIHTPKLVAGATEGGANLFPVQYFDRQAYLAQSPQLYKQMMVGVFERVFEIAPVFRAEPHATTRHLNEYVSVDVEIAFIEDHRTVMAFLQSSLAEAFASLAEMHATDLALLGVAVPVIGEIPAIHFRDALQLLYERHGEDGRDEPDLAPQHERWLCEWAMETQGSPFLFVTHYPTIKRPFYTMGFAIGLERLVMQLIGARNVRETTLFPRDIHRLTP
ncbi:MAG: aspartate--tRNA(Asn) ligase [Thermomicrobia bacterium]|nr:aspartate--tRNA(Asn) ligase [Thermomicrobia bacterium]